MSVETASTINELDATRPLAADLFSEGDDHIRLLKSTTKATFPNVLGVVTPTHTELNRVVGVTSAIQTQINNLSSSSAAAFSHASSYLTGTVGKKLQRTVHVSDAPYSAVGDGVTDDKAAFLAAATALGAAGGTILYTQKHLIDSSFTVPANVTIKGPMSLVGTPGVNTSAPYGSMAALIVNSAATITLSGGAGVDGVLAYRKGMTFPASDSSAFAGTCFTAAADDCFVINSQILGFNKAYYSSGYARPRIQNLWFDCLAGLEIINCYDIAHIRNCHAWPFATIESYAVTPTVTKLQRSGTAFLFSNVGDWNKVTDCFSYGHYRGFNANNVNNMTFMNCGADNTSTLYVGSIGFVADGTSNDTRLVACQAAAQDTGFQVNTSANLKTRLLGCDSWVCATASVVVQAGDASVLGGNLRNTVNGVQITNANSKVMVDGVQFSAISGLPVALTVANPYVQIGMCDYGDLAAGTSIASVANKTNPTVASAAALNLPNNGSIFNVTGTTNITGINGGYAGREVTLIFGGSLTVTSATSTNASVYLKGGVNLSATANTAIRITHNGTQWYELR